MCPLGFLPTGWKRPKDDRQPISWYQWPSLVVEKQRTVRGHLRDRQELRLDMVSMATLGLHDYERDQLLPCKPGDSHHAVPQSWVEWASRCENKLVLNEEFDGDKHISSAWQTCMWRFYFYSPTTGKSLGVRAFTHLLIQGVTFWFEKHS